MLRNAVRVRLWRPSFIISNVPFAVVSGIGRQVRTWARLIREAEALWHVDVRALRRMGAVELSQLIEEVPPTHRQRVNRWLECYSVFDPITPRARFPGA